MNKLEIHEFEDKKSFDKWMNDFNKSTAKVFDDAFKYYVSMCENEEQKQIFADWWKGKCVSTEEYESKYTKEDNYNAGSIILTAVSNGFG